MKNRRKKRKERKKERKKRGIHMAGKGVGIGEGKLKDITHGGGAADRTEARLLLFCFFFYFLIYFFGVVEFVFSLSLSSQIFIIIIIIKKKKKRKNRKMAQSETLGGIHEEIESLVSDKLQVVSYKWLSRNFLVSSNAAKRLLQEFVETHGNGLEVVYALSGWLKNNPTSYHIRLVSSPKLEEAKKEFDGNCSVQVYSVQACIPKDPAALWNAEFLQAEELFKQPSGLENCLRDNKYSGILNSLVKRKVDGSSVNTATPQLKFVGSPGPSKNSAEHQKIVVPAPQPIKVKQSSPKPGVQSQNVAKAVKVECDGTENHNQLFLAQVDGEKAFPLASNDKKGHNIKSTSGNGGSLANLWGRASVKSKPDSVPADNSHHISNPNASSEAQICARGAAEYVGSDDEAQDVNFRQTSNGERNRKRKMVLDYSDDESEDAVNLASPGVPKGQTSKTLPLEELNVHEQTEDKLKLKEDKSTVGVPDQLSKQDSSIVSKGIENDAKENVITNVGPNSPKRRKVLKTWIDKRGREVTEVVWEGEEQEINKDDSITAKKAEDNSVANTVNRAPANKKSPAVGNTAGGKAGTKKGAIKDSKQGNILSFFKRV